MTKRTNDDTKTHYKENLRLNNTHLKTGRGDLR